MNSIELAEILKLEHRGSPVPLTGIAPLEEAGPGDLSFVTLRKFLDQAPKAAAVILARDLADQFTGTCLLSRAPALDFARAAKQFGWRENTFSGIDPAAIIHPTARLGQGVAVGARAVIGADTEIGADTVIHPGAVILERSVVGSRCVIQSNAVIGSDGFGYEVGERGLERIPHLGRVVLEDDVEVGACTTIDRARFGETRIGAGTKIDNLVQIAHNVQVGRNVIIVAQVGIAGSCRIEDGAVLAGQAGLVPHVTVGKGAKVAASTGVAGDVPPGKSWSGWWGKEHRQNLREVSLMEKLPDFVKRVERFMKEHGG